MSRVREGRHFQLSHTGPAFLHERLIQMSPACVHLDGSGRPRVIHFTPFPPEPATLPWVAGLPLSLARNVRP